MENTTNLKACLIASLFLLLLGPAVAAADIIYVDAAATGTDNGSSWANAYNYLQDALADANSDFNVDQIRVAQGVYTPDTYSANPNGSGDRYATFQLINGVTIYGGFPAGGAKLAQRNPDVYEGILSGDLDGNDIDVNDPCDLLTEPTRGENSYHVVTGDDTDANAILDGFTITAGYANGPEPDITDIGGGMHNAWGNPTVKNCTFKANAAAELESEGGAMYNYQSTPTLTDCSFSKNACADEGGAIRNHYSSPTLTDCTFSNNWAYSGGGGMYNRYSSPTLTNCTFSGNWADEGGGMYNYTNSSPTLTNCTFTGNWADLGGGMFNRDNSSPTLTNCAFTRNKAAVAQGGGMANMFNSSPTLTNCMFSGNYATSYGGGMYNYQSNPILTNCTLSSNLANSRGGGMYNNSSSPTVNNCTFSGNSANSGGGMYNATGSSPTLTNCTFTGNWADDLGGGMYNYDSSPALTNCTFTDNSAEQNNGGGMYNYNGSSPTLNNCTFSGNRASYWGGGMFNYSSSSPTLTNCTFSGNTAIWGGGMYNSESSPALTNCTFSENSADEGGGMYNYTNSSPTLTNCTFTGNWADLGGGMFNRTNSSPTLTNCAFTRNKAAVAQGGGMANMFNSSSTLTNCTFSGNYATSYGGGMYNYESNPILTNCTLSSNLATSAGGGMYNSWDSSPTLTNCILWANSDSGGMDESAQIHTNSGTPLVNYTCIQGTWTGSGSNNIDDDPLFVREPNDGGDGWGIGDNDDFGDLHLQAGSPCIDAGDNTALSADAYDLDGDGDTNEPIPWDADTHPRFLDVSTVPDTGNGTPPIVDMGAYEYANMKIKKCKAAAGSRPGRDSFTCSAKMYATRPQIIDANQITVSIWGADDYPVYSETINVKPIKLKKGNYIYKHRVRKKRNRGFITYFAVDLKKHTFSLKAKKIDLTGLSCPLFVGIEVGDYVGLGKATERIVNGKKKRIPIRFMRGYADTLRAGKRRVKPRYLKIRGGIAVADWPNPANLKTQDVTITWGTQEFTIPAGSFYTRKKWNNKYKCAQAPVLQGGIQDGIATATVDFKKCRFKVLIKKTKIDSRSGLVDFAIKFDTFDQTVQLNL